MSIINFSYSFEQPNDSKVGVLYIHADIPANDAKMTTELSKVSQVVMLMLQETISATDFHKTTKDGMETWTLDIYLGGDQSHRDKTESFRRARDIITSEEKTMIKMYNLKKKNLKKVN